MAIEHFKTPESINGSGTQPNTLNLPKGVVSQDELVSLQSRDDTWNKKETNSSESECESECESSSEDNDITYHKPIFIRKTTVPKGSLNKESSIPIEDIEKKRLNQRIEHSLTVTKNLSLNEINIDHNYTSTDKDLLKRTLLLNDDDTIDHDLEEKKWNNRQQLRLDRERKKLVQKQLEFEERQERLLKRSSPSIGNNDDDRSIKISINGNKSTEAKNNSKKRKVFDSSKPRRVIDTTFTKYLPSSSVNKDVGGNDNGVNEYSIF